MSHSIHFKYDNYYLAASQLKLVCTKYQIKPIQAENFLYKILFFSLFKRSVKLHIKKNVLSDTMSESTLSFNFFKKNYFKHHVLCQIQHTNNQQLNFIVRSFFFSLTFCYKISKRKKL